MAERAEVIVVGMGPGTEDVAGKLAEAGLEVVGIDAELVGGECPYWGCIPSKMMIRAANLLTEARRIPGMAGDATVRPDWTPVAARIREEATDNWDDTVAVKRFEGKGGRFVRGWGRLDGPRRVVVGDRTFEASRAIVLGVGARSSIPPIPGLAETPYWTNREAIEVETLPATLAILGGGPVGVELGQVFSRFGVEVTVLEVAERLLATEDPESSELLATVFEREGIAVHTSVNVESVSHDGHRFTITPESAEPVMVERLLVASGRRPDLQGLNVGSIGVDADADAIPVDDHMRVTDGVWAVGDMTGKVGLHPRVDVPGRHLHRRHPRSAGDRSRLPGHAPGDVHRPRRSARSDSTRRRPGTRASPCEWAGPRSPSRRAVGSTRPATTGSSSWSPMLTGAPWWGPPQPGRWAARCSGC